MADRAADIDPSLPKPLRRLYAEIPESNCKGLCWEQCTKVPCSPAELENLVRIGGNPPQTSALCRYLTPERRCGSYPARPLICRLFGISAAPRLRCPHGCEPRLSAKKSGELVRRSVEISPGLRSLDTEIDAVCLFGGEGDRGRA